MATAHSHTAGNAHHAGRHRAQPGDRAHLLAFGQDRLTYEVVHIVNTADYNKYMDIQQEINIRIIEKLIENDIELALPSLVVRAPVQVEETRDYSDTADAKNADKRVIQ
ncbi:mechanosensitive ion channel [Salmonella enterica subsp. enterica serovar Anatum]|nr:mechanosensitive ion channel [Salmonella enterica subsp. enterica serovar Anatum]